MIILPSAYLAPVGYYSYLASGNQTVRDVGEHFVKQTYRNRCRILGARGVETLVVPIEHAGSATHQAIKDLRISTHEPHWQRHHWHSLRTAYEGTPFFMFYADDLKPLYERPYTFLCDWNTDLENTICQLLGLQQTIATSTTYIVATNCDTDLRKNFSTKAHSLPWNTPIPYWQIHAAPGSFVPNLSIVDLLFNLGPEARLLLQHSSSTEA